MWIAWALLILVEEFCCSVWGKAAFKAFHGVLGSASAFLLGRGVVAGAVARVDRNERLLARELSF